MILKARTIFCFFLLLVVSVCVFAFSKSQSLDDTIISYSVNPASRDLKFYWKDDAGTILGSFGALKKYVETGGRTLLFAMNGGMYMENQHPLGLFVQNGKQISKLNTKKAQGNFYMMPNGVFYMTSDKKAGICTTEDYHSKKNVSYATQSGPMLLLDGDIHPDFTKGSSNLNIRNGVGILPDNKVIFAISKHGINFYDFAMYFKNLGCKNALYLDGFVSRTYLPEKKWEQLDGHFGVIIAVTK